MPNLNPSPSPHIAEVQVKLQHGRTLLIQNSDVVSLTPRQTKAVILHLIENLEQAAYYAGSAVGYDEQG